MSVAERLRITVKWASVVPSHLTARIAALEEHVAHQDAAIEDLNATITAQWGTIDAMAREVAMLGERLHDLARREPGAAEPPPPHY